EPGDLLADLGGGIRRRAAAGDVAADVVDHHLRAFARQRERDPAADAPARAGDHGDLAFEELRHRRTSGVRGQARTGSANTRAARSEEHTSELQSRGHLVCRLLLEKKSCSASKIKW